MVPTSRRSRLRRTQDQALTVHLGEGLPHGDGPLLEIDVPSTQRADLAVPQACERRHEHHRLEPRRHPVCQVEHLGDGEYRALRRPLRPCAGDAARVPSDELVMLDGGVEDRAQEPLRLRRHRLRDSLGQQLTAPTWRLRAHSDFSADPLRRLRGTLDAFLTVTFGDRLRGSPRCRARRRPASDGAGKTSRRHRPVPGRHALSRRGPGPRSVGVCDPGVVLGGGHRRVHSTRGLVGAGSFLPGHDPVGARFRVPAALLTDQYSALERYVHDQVHDVLTVGPTAARRPARSWRPTRPFFHGPRGPCRVSLPPGCSLAHSGTRTGFHGASANKALRAPPGE